jgi:hypothetical protein
MDFCRCTLPPFRDAPLSVIDFLAMQSDQALQAEATNGSLPLHLLAAKHSTRTRVVRFLAIEHPEALEAPKRKRGTFRCTWRPRSRLPSRSSDSLPTSTRRRHSKARRKAAAGDAASAAPGRQAQHVRGGPMSRPAVLLIFDPRRFLRTSASLKPLASSGGSGAPVNSGVPEFEQRRSWRQRRS